MILCLFSFALVSLLSMVVLASAGGFESTAIDWELISTTFPVVIAVVVVVVAIVVIIGVVISARAFSAPGFSRWVSAVDGPRKTVIGTVPKSEKSLSLRNDNIHNV